MIVCLVPTFKVTSLIVPVIVLTFGEPYVKVWQMAE